MTMVFLVGLLTAWVGYFAYCGIKDSGAILHGRNGTAAFNRSLGALSQASMSSIKQHPENNRMAGGSRVRLNHPRSSREAGQRRRNVMIGLAVIAVAALVSTLEIGTIGWVIHFAADLALLGFVSLAVHLRHRSAEHEMRALLLNHGQPAAGTQSVAVGPVPQTLRTQRVAIR